MRTTLIIILILLFSLGTLALFGLERRLIYYPSREMGYSPKDVGLSFEEVWLRSSDGLKVHGWYVPAPGAKATLLFSHGNAGTIADRVDNLRLLHHLLGVNVLIYDYRGYGRSEGSPNEEGTYRDAEAARQWLLERPDAASTRLVYFGRSLGAAVTVELAKRHAPAGVILESPFTSIADMAKVIFPGLPSVGPLLRTRYESIKKVGSIKAPLLLLHGDRDEVVPYLLGERLFAAANEPKTFYRIEGAGHNDTYAVGGRPYWEAWRRFLEGL